MSPGIFRYAFCEVGAFKEKSARVERSYEGRKLDELFVDFHGDGGVFSHDDAHLLADGVHEVLAIDVKLNRLGSAGGDRDQDQRAVSLPGEEEQNTLLRDFRDLDPRLKLLVHVDGPIMVAVRLNALGKTSRHPRNQHLEPRVSK